ncbi:MAG: sulfatase-like hydrolase/transferase [Pirellulales bacterium]|nr:sulfatase-like hydrolase/transferase [Pirellulales bacterium]
MRLLFLALVALFLPSVKTGFADAADVSRPNLIAIVTDDQGRWACGAYGNRDIHTPHLDRLAREGAIFTNAITATPVCSPSRAIYFSGRWPTQVGITDYFAVEETDAGAGIRASLWPASLQQAGYRTGLIGKWHLGTQPPFHPTRLGFDHFMGFLGGGNTPMDPTLEVAGEVRKLKGSLPDLLVDDALQFLRDNRERPFALSLHFRAPHRPYGPVPAEDAAHYESLDPQIPDVRGLDVQQVKRSTRNYYASISSVDRNVGRLLDALDELELTENTWVVFTSDHGYNEGRHGVDTKGNAQWIIGGMAGPKVPNMWETSICVPLLMRWPAVIEPGTTIDAPVSNIDMYRTVLGGLGVAVPADCQAAGIDYSPLLRGEDLPERDALFGQYDLHNGGLAYLRMIRTRDYKYVRHFHTRFMDELYDLRHDPDEKHNLLDRRGGEATAIQARLAELQQRLTEWQRSIDDPLLDDAY